MPNKSIGSGLGAARPFNQGIQQAQMQQAQMGPYNSLAAAQQMAQAQSLQNMHAQHIQAHINSFTPTINNGYVDYFQFMFTAACMSAGIHRTSVMEDYLKLWAAVTLKPESMRDCVVWRVMKTYVKGVAKELQDSMPGNGKGSHYAK